MLGKWFNLSRKVLKSNIGTLDRPFKLTCVVTKECHSKCVNCSIWKVKPQNELRLEEYQRLAQNSPFLSWIDFTGGEPTDRKDFVEIVQAFTTHCPDLLAVHFPTNGLKPKRIEAAARGILELKPGRLIITVSIDGPPEVNDILRGIPGDFKRAVETFNRLRALSGMRVFAGMTLYPDNLRLIDDTVNAIAAEVPGFTYRDLHVNLPNISEHYYENKEQTAKATAEMVDIVEGVAAQRGFARSPFELVEQMYQRRARRFIETGKCPQVCASLLSSCFLSEQGVLFPCIVWNHPLGSIRDTDYNLVPLLQTEETVQIRGRIKAGNCPQCWTPCEAYQTLLANLLKWN